MLIVDKIKKLLKEQNISEKELEMIVKKANSHSKDIKTYEHLFSDRHTKIGVISDTHIGHKKFDEKLLMRAFKEFEKEKVEAIYHVGDVVEGMSGRDGHIYELTHIGASPQIEYASNLFSTSKIQIYGITANHDNWFKNKGNMGLDTGSELEKRTKQFKFLGENEADVMLAKNTRMKLFHPNDGTAYAHSYKLQKLIESFTGGDKPNLVLEGHYHKAIYQFLRNTHGFECGTICGQTPFMRGKKIAAHKGYWIIDIYHNKTGIERLRIDFTPDYD